MHGLACVSLATFATDSAAAEAAMAASRAASASATRASAASTPCLILSLAVLSRCCSSVDCSLTRARSGGQCLSLLSFNAVHILMNYVTPPHHPMTAHPQNRRSN